MGPGLRAHLQHAAVDRPRRPGDVARRARREKGDDRRDLTGVARSAQGDADANAQLDEAFAALVSGDTASAAAILASFE